MAVATTMPWASWHEWHEAYSLFFALDEPAKRTLGVELGEVWRARGQLPLAVDATAALTELALLIEDAPHAASEHAVRLMYAMTITRLVNGVVDPLQQGARAVSVKFLAQTVGLPPMLVELRHECTHNQLPSLGRLRHAAEHALLWLHEHYWLRQRALLSNLHTTLDTALSTYDHATRRRAARGEPPLRKHVLACATELERVLHPVQLSTHLVPALLDGGFLAPRPATGAGTMTAATSAADADGSTEAAAAVDVSNAGAQETEGGEEVLEPTWEERRLQWSVLLARLYKLWKRQSLFGQSLHASLLLGCVKRLEAEAAARGAGGAGDAGGAPGGLASTPAPASARRLLALQRWALHFLEESRGGGCGGGGTAGAMEADAADASAVANVALVTHATAHAAEPDADAVSGALERALLLDAETVRLLISTAARAAAGWGRPVVLRALRLAADSHKPDARKGEGRPLLPDKVPNTADNCSSALLCIPGGRRGASAGARTASAGRRASGSSVSSGSSGTLGQARRLLPLPNLAVELPNLVTHTRRLLRLQAAAAAILRVEPLSTDAVTDDAPSATETQPEAMEEEAVGEAAEAAAEAAGMVVAPAGDETGDEGAAVDETGDQGAAVLRARFSRALAPGSAWRVCRRWTPIPLGEAPPPVAVLAALGGRAAPLDTGKLAAAFEALEEPPGRGDHRGSASGDDQTVPDSAPLSLSVLRPKTGEYADLPPPAMAMAEGWAPAEATSDAALAAKMEVARAPAAPLPVRLLVRRQGLGAASPAPNAVQPSAFARVGGEAGGATGRKRSRSADRGRRAK